MTDQAGWGRPPGSPGRPDLGGPEAAELFGRIFDEHASPLHRYLARRVGGHTADDLVAETFLVAFRCRRSYDPARAAVVSWLYGIATNLLRRHLHRELAEYQAIARAAGGIHPSEDGHPARSDDRVDADRRVRRLAAALSALSPGDRDVLLLTAWAALDSREVAEALEIPVGTVRSRLHRVRRQLRASGGQD